MPEQGSVRGPCRGALDIEGTRYAYFPLGPAAARHSVALERMPLSVKILAENLLRHEDGHTVTEDHLRSLLRWSRDGATRLEVPFHPGRVLMPDSSGIPLLVDLAAMRDAMAERGKDPARVNPVIPLDLVVDHSVMVDRAATPDALAFNLRREYERNRERYAFLRWAESSIANLRVIPPGNGICHQINLETLARVVTSCDQGNERLAYPDSLVGMDSHTPMVNALGVLGWGVGGIEATAAALGQPILVALSAIVGCRIVGTARPGVTTTDIVLTLTELLRCHGVVNAFVEFYGPGVAALSLPERATLANMAPEYGASMGLFPIDRETLRYLALTGRAAQQVKLVEAYARAQSLWRANDAADPDYAAQVTFDLATVEPSTAGPKRPQDRLPLARVPETFEALVGGTQTKRPVEGSRDSNGRSRRLRDGDVVLAAITSCTNTSNPQVMIAAGLLARNAVQKGLHRKPWVKTSLAPGSRVVADYLEAAGLQPALDALGFNLVGFGCTTCMGNSGPLTPEVADAVEAEALTVAAVLSGNRNFEARIHPLVKASYLMSPPLVVAYALAGSLLIDIESDPFGHDDHGNAVYLRDIWPAPDEIDAVVARVVTTERFQATYGVGPSASADWDALEAPPSARFPWVPASSYLRRPPFFDETCHEAVAPGDIRGARVLAILGDSITTDHISPVGTIATDGPAGRYLRAQGVEPEAFNSFLSRRANHEVMIRGTFANGMLRNEMVPGRTGGLTRVAAEAAETSIYEAAERYRAQGTPLVIVAGREYGTGSSRDWAAKGTRLLGVRAVLAESFERIHRANLVGMGVLPLQFPGGVTRKTLGLDGTESIDLVGLQGTIAPLMNVTALIHRQGGTTQSLPLTARIETGREAEWYAHGGVLSYVLRAIMGEDAP